ncbi:diguanylate cyclase [Geothrix sp.]|jgi:diguanylate cyclase (GGDEF)-like protein|uniref:GGDEF domain-containing protein n=1 Tax=Geothrix sp. TaxID=1962974 RepID=UPI0025B9AB80|nr:diguanylate cyclase [Geothrix sp.]
MNLLVISRHDDLVERLRMAFEGAGHRILHVGDPLEALAKDAWSEAHVLLVDAGGDPMDGYRLCRLLRGETRILFRNLPIFVVVDHPPTEQDQEALREVGGDGFIPSRHTIQQLLNHLGPVVAGAATRGEAERVPVLALGLHPGLALKARDLLHHFLMEVHSPPARNAAEAQRVLKAPVLLLGLTGGVSGALARLEHLRDQGCLPYTILVGQVKDEAMQRKFLLAGVSDWVPVPLSAPRLLHACKRAIEWVHARRIQGEYESAIHDLRERRSMLEIEAAALRNEVLTDPLTELLNRRAFDQNLEHAVRQWERHRRGFVLLLGDVDHFKLINDRFGHPVGDEVLRQLAVRIRSALRRSDLAFRIGGEEFAVLLTETSLKAGAEVAEKLRRRIDEDPIALATGQTLFPTMSFGVGGPGSQNPTDLLAVVDKALYQAKRLGRNRVVVAEGGGRPPRALSAGS